MTDLNETPVLETTKRPKVWVGSHRLLFEGPIEDLQWHRHSFVCVLVGVDEKMTLVTRGHPEHVGDVVLVPGGVDHQLRFGRGRVLSYYIGPHDADYAALMRCCEHTDNVFNLSLIHI